MNEADQPAPSGGLEPVSRHQTRAEIAGTVHDRFALTARRYWDNDFLVLPERLRQQWGYGQSSWTYSQTVKIVAKLAERYRLAGYGAGHRVALLMSNRPDHYFHWLALNQLTISVVPVNPNYQAEEMRYLLEHSEVVLVVTAAEFEPQIKEVAGQLGVALTTCDDHIPPSLKRPSPDGTNFQNVECTLLYTSGTTGRPKGCVLSNAYFLGWGEWYAAQGGLISLRAGKERLLQPLPTYHINAMGNSFMGMMFTGGAQIILDRFHPRSWWQDAVATQATCFHYLGVMPAMLLNLDKSDDETAHQFRFGMGGGVHPDSHASFEARFGVPLLEGWAMTETGSGGILCTTDEPRTVGNRCIGNVNRHGYPVKTRIVGETGQNVAVGEVGELLIAAAGPDPRKRYFSEYLKDPQATAEIWQGGWLHTGDIVYADTAGNLYFVDRKKIIIRRSGENIAAAEVEDILVAHTKVNQAAVVAAPDPIREGEVLAVVKLKANCPADRAAAKDIVAHCRKRLAYYKVPGYVVFVDALPTTPTQKIQKGKLRHLIKRFLEQTDCYDLRQLKKPQKYDRA